MRDIHLTNTLNITYGKYRYKNRKVRIYIDTIYIGSTVINQIDETITNKIKFT